MSGEYCYLTCVCCIYLFNVDNNSKLFFFIYDLRPIRIVVPGPIRDQ